MEAHNFKMTQYINKQITDVSYTTKQPREKIFGTSIAQNLNKPMSGHGTDSSSVNK